MPEFKMPTGRTVAGFNELGSFIQGYVEAMFFTIDESESDKTFDDIAGDTLQKIIVDCQSFQRNNHLLLTLAYNMQEYDESQAGRDFWFDRNGHGVGFWDRGLMSVGDDLALKAGHYPETDLYSGDDNLLYLG